MEKREWNFDFCVGDYGDYQDVELFRHNNHSVLLSRYAGADKKESGDWFATVRTSTEGGDFGDPRELNRRLTQGLVSLLYDHLLGRALVDENPEIGGACTYAQFVGAGESRYRRLGLGRIYMGRSNRMSGRNKGGRKDGQVLC